MENSAILYSKVLMQYQTSYVRIIHQGGEYLALILTSLFIYKFFLPS